MLAPAFAETSDPELGLVPAPGPAPMRWKLLRRRLSVSAPRVMVRSHLPWPLRWAVVAVVLGFSGALALWAFEFGREIAGLDRVSKEELVQLRAEVERLRADRDRAQATANTADSLLRAERVAQERLAEQVRQLEAERQSLQADLGFFENLLPTRGEDGIQMRGLQMQRVAPGRWRFQMLVMQNGKTAADFHGSYELQLIGLLDGRPWSQVLTGSDQPLRFKQYARVERAVDHAPEVLLKTVQVKVTDQRGALRATQTLKL